MQKIYICFDGIYMYKYTHTKRPPTDIACMRTHYSSLCTLTLKSSSSSSFLAIIRLRDSSSGTSSSSSSCTASASKMVSRKARRSLPTRTRVQVYWMCMDSTVRVVVTHNCSMHGIEQQIDNHTCTCTCTCMHYQYWNRLYLHVRTLGFFTIVH